MIQIWALRSRLEKQPTDPAMAGRKPRSLWDRTLGYHESQLRCLLVPTIPQFTSSEPLREIFLACATNSKNRVVFFALGSRFTHD
jgi:hypothetical protein